MKNTETANPLLRKLDDTFKNYNVSAPSSRSPAHRVFTCEVKRRKTFKLNPRPLEAILEGQVEPAGGMDTRI